MTRRASPRTLGIAALTCALLVAPRGVTAQEGGCTVGSGSACSIDVSLRVDIPSVVSLSLSDASLVIPSPILTSGADGVTVQGPTAIVSANTEWQLLISTATATWRSDSENRRAKPASDLTWSTTRFGPFMPMSPSPAVMLGGGPGGNRPVPTWLRALFDAARDGPGRYEITVSYTIIAP